MRAQRAQSIAVPCQLQRSLADASIEACASVAGLSDNRLGGDDSRETRAVRGVLDYAGRSWSLLYVSMPLAAQSGTNRVALVRRAAWAGRARSHLEHHGAPARTAPSAETSTGDVDVWTESVGMSALFYLRSADALRTFVVDPRVSYSYSSITGGATGKT